jgi:hypothetical protein
VYTAGQPAQYILYCTLQNILCRLACFVHNSPTSPKFQILPSQLRLTADRAAGIIYKGSLGEMVAERRGEGGGEGGIS